MLGLGTAATPFVTATAVAGAAWARTLRGSERRTAERGRAALATTGRATMEEARWAPPAATRELEDFRVRGIFEVLQDCVE